MVVKYWGTLNSKITTKSSAIMGDAIHLPSQESRQTKDLVGSKTALWSKTWYFAYPSFQSQKRETTKLFVD